jgi:hypothetical protein
VAGGAGEFLQSPAYRLGDQFQTGQVLFDARRKLRAALAANGYLSTYEAEPKDTGAVRRS